MAIPTRKIAGNPESPCTPPTLNAPLTHSSRIDGRPLLGIDFRGKPKPSANWFTSDETRPTQIGKHLHIPCKSHAHCNQLHHIEQNIKSNISSSVVWHIPVRLNPGLKAIDQQIWIDLLTVQVGVDGVATEFQNSQRGTPVARWQAHCRNIWHVNYLLSLLIGVPLRLPVRG